MRRRSFIYILGALLCLMQVGCYDDSYTGTVFVQDYEDTGIPHEVRITIGSDEEQEASKGSGVVGSVDKFAGKDFYVYAFNHDIKTSYSTLTQTDSLRCLVDGSYDEPDTKRGRKAVYNPETEHVEWGAGDSPVYYPMGENEGHIYDFFAYYLDNIQPEEEDIHRNDDNVVIDIEIDGCQDIMSSKAKPTKRQLSVIKDEREQLYQQKYSYSYYTASHNLNPHFVFTHHLVKLDFKLVPGGTPGMTKDVTVEKIEVLSKTKAEFTVADKYDENRLGLAFKDEKSRLQLKEHDGSEYIPRLITTYDQVGGITDGIVNDLGSLLVAPDDEYYIYITLGEIQGDIILESKENEVHIFYGKDEENKIPFTAGSEYLITMTIYGQMDVRVSTQIGEWDAGGDYEYDYDDVMRPGQ